MSPLQALHATRVVSRDSIATRGLLCSVGHRIFGVYVFSEDGSFDHPIFSRAHRVTWSSNRGHDVWQVSYIGPVTVDPYVTNGLVFLERVQPQEVTLVTRHGEGS